MSDLRKMWERHEQEIEALRKTCKHPKNMITIRHDKSSVGAGTLEGSIVVTCTNCGTKKIIHDLNVEQRDKVKKQLSRQGFRNERLNCYVKVIWELDQPNEEPNEGESDCSQGRDCPNCDNQGWYVVADRHTGEPMQEQCEWCYTVEDSKFNLANDKAHFRE